MSPSFSKNKVGLVHVVDPLLTTTSPDSTWIYLGILHIAAGNTGIGHFTRPCIHSLKSMLMRAAYPIMNLLSERRMGVSV